MAGFITLPNTQKKVQRNLTAKSFNLSMKSGKL